MKKNCVICGYVNRTAETSLQLIKDDNQRKQRKCKRLQRSNTSLRKENKSFKSLIRVTIKYFDQNLFVFKIH